MLDDLVQDVVRESVVAHETEIRAAIERIGVTASALLNRLSVERGEDGWTLYCWTDFEGVRRPLVAFGPVQAYERQGDGDETYIGLRQQVKRFE